MGVQSALGYEFRRPNPFQRATQRLASSAAGAKMFSRITQPLDGLVHRVSRGRTTLSDVLAGLPVLYVTTTGRKSGQPREAPLLAVPIDDELALIGSNFGGRSTPAWVYNLEADPSASVRFREQAVDVVARPATEEEYERVFAEGARYYAGYAKYRSRVVNRDIRVFILTEA